MKRIVLFCTLALTAAVSYGCSEDRPSPTEMTELQAAFGKSTSGGGTTDDGTNPKALWEWQTYHSGTVLSAIRGDGKARNGTDLLRDALLTGAYEGSVCGVRATIFWSGTNYGGDAVFDPDLEMSKGAKCGPRSIRLSLGGVLQPAEAPFMNAFAIMYVPRADEPQYVPGDTQAYAEGGRLQWLRIINRSDKTCERLQWGSPTESSTDEHWRADSPGILVTRLAGSYATRGGGKWEVKSVGNHTATCYAWVQGEYRATSQTYEMPFRVVITELQSTGPLHPPAS